MATAQKLTDHFLTCTVCHEVFTDPSTLACGHSFCGQCIVKFTKTREDAIGSRSMLCPFCWRLTPVPDPSRPVDEWAGQMRPTLLLRGLLDTIGPGAKDTTNCNLCHDEGETTQAVSWCSICDISLCDNCLKAHRRNPASRHHALADMTEEVKVTRNRKVTCHEHKEEFVKFFCRDCRKTLCQSCCILYHRKCESVVSLESMVPEMRRSLQVRKESLLEKAREEEKRLESIKTKYSGLNEMKPSVQSQIRSTAQEAIEAIQEKEKVLLEQLNDVAIKQMDQLNTDVKTGNMARDIYRQQSELIDQALDSESEMDIYDLYQSCGSEAAESVGDLKERGTRTRMRFSQDMDGVHRALSELSLGKIEILDDVVLDTIVCRTKEDEFNPILYDVTRMVVKEKEILLVADSSNMCLKSFYEFSSEQHHSYLKTLNPPAQMSKLEDNKIVVSLPAAKQIAVVSVTPGLALESTIATAKEYTGLTVLTPTTLAAGASCPPGIDILDMSGQTVRSISPRYNEHEIIRQPDFLCTTRRGNILIGNLGTKSVVSVTQTGKVVFSYSPTGEGALKGLRGLAASVEGCIYVVDHWGNKVVQLSESGEFVRDMLTSQDGLRLPWGIHADERGRIFVTRESKDKGDTVQIFTSM